MSFRVDSACHLRHLDSISFRPAALRRFSKLTPSRLEKVEGIELMRALEHGMVLGTVVLEGDSYSVNVREDYERAQRDILTDPVRRQY
jgi:3-deoxy-manno-octulosonate cytidylyltransferase (CMP-KDO synthetase)